MDNQTTERDYARKMRLEHWQACIRVMEDSMREGLLRVNLRSYAAPWPEAVANNPAIWKRLAEEWRQGNLLLWGVNGVGKSALARNLLALALMRTKQPWACVADISATDFAVRLCRMEQSKAFERIKRVPTLLIDDLDKAPWAPYSLSMLLEFIDYRSENNLATIATANMQEFALQEVFEKARPENISTAIAIVSRFKHGYQGIRMEGRDLRTLPKKGS